MVNVYLYFVYAFYCFWFVKFIYNTTNCTYQKYLHKLD